MTERTASYDPTREHRDFEAELARLEAQVAVSWHAELRQLRLLGVRDGDCIVDLGCGPGFATSRLREAFPASALIGVDADQRLLDLAIARDSRAAAWHLASAEATTLDDASVDVVFARYLFQHLADPVAVAREARRILRPGGLFVVVDVDAALWGIVDPQFPEVIPIHMRTGAAQARRGGNRRIGRALWRILAQAALEDVALDIVAYHSDAQGLDPFVPQLDPARLLPLVRDGVVTPAEMTLLDVTHQRFLDAPNAYVMMLAFMASGRRPRAG